jgi:GGDEF domain-containing protein
MSTTPTKSELEILVHALSWNDNYDCYTRAGLEKIIWPKIARRAKFVIFIDVDDMHSLNEQHGYDGVNDIIKMSLSIRKSDYVAGQWFSGDEIAVFITDDPQRVNSDPVEMCQRLLEAFKKHGASATFGIAPVKSTHLETVIKPAFELVQRAKSENRRGTINLADGV